MMYAFEKLMSKIEPGANPGNKISSSFLTPTAGETGKWDTDDGTNFYSMPPDEQSVDSAFASLRRRDPEALDAAVHEHARALFRSARALGFNESEAEDLVQDVFVTFLEKIDSFEGRSQLRTWLIGILHHKALEHRRQQSVGGKCDAIDDVLGPRPILNACSNRGGTARSLALVWKSCLPISGRLSYCVKPKDLKLTKL